MHPDAYPPELAVSKGGIDRAGERLRAWFADAATDEHDSPVEVPMDDLDILLAFREQFPNPMKKVTVGVRQFVARESEEGAQITVGQRLKRGPQIVMKLARHPAMKLSRMQDIGGCRAILSDNDEVERVARRIERNWVVKHQKLYTLEAPAPSGYRARHLVVERDNRLIEIQLRTVRQHEWAEAIERTDKRLGLDMKSGSGPPDLLEYFRVAADGLAIEDAGLLADPAFMRHFQQARNGAQKYFQGG